MQRQYFIFVSHVPDTVRKKMTVVGAARSKRTRGVSESQPLTPRVRFVRGSENASFFPLLFYNRICNNCESIKSMAPATNDAAT